MKIARENLDKIRSRLGDTLFNELYDTANPVARDFEIVDVTENEIRIMMPFEYANNKTEWLGIWTKKFEWDIIENVKDEIIVALSIRNYINSLDFCSPDDIVKNITILVSERLLSSQERKIYIQLDENGKTAREVANMVGLETKNVSSILLNMYKKTSLIRYEDIANRRHRRYFKNH